MSAIRHPDVFDPEQVPVFPVLTLELTADRGAKLNGQDLQVRDGEDPIDVGVAAAAAHARMLPGQNPAIRVRGVDPQGDVFPLVVRVDGTVHELTPPAPPARRPRWLWPAVASVSAVVVGASATTAVVLARGVRPRPVSVAAASLPGAGANLPILAPTGYSQRATWAVPIQPQVPPIATAAGDILAVTENGDLTLLAGRTGRALWTGKSAPSGGELHLIRDGDRPVVATASNRELTLWPLPVASDTTTDPDLAARPITIPLPPQAAVTFDGSTPLVTLPDQTAAMIRQGALARVDIPVGATPIAADQDSIIAVTTTTTWYDIAPGHTPVAHTLQRPAGTARATMRTLAAGPDHLVTIWTTQDLARVALHDLGTGRVVGSTTTPVTATQGDVHHQSDGHQLSVGSVLIDYGPQPSVIALPAAFRPTGLTNGHVYGEIDRQPAEAVVVAGHARIATPAAPPAPKADGQTAQTATEPIATTPQYAYIPAHKVEQYLLYAIPSTGGSPS